MAYAKNIAVNTGSSTTTYTIFTTVTNSTALGPSMNLNNTSVTATGVTSTSTVFVSPAPASQDVYTAAGIKCIGQGSGVLYFSAASAPSAAVTVNIVIFG